MSVKFKLADLETKSIPRTRSLLQGDPAAPSIFNITIDDPLEEFHREAQRRNWGIKLQDGNGDTFNLAIICFADNYWLIARSAEQLKKMTKEWLRLLGFRLAHPT